MLQFPLVLMNRLNEQPSLLFLFVCSLHLHQYSGDIFHILVLHRAARSVTFLTADPSSIPARSISSWRLMMKKCLWPYSSIPQIQEGLFSVTSNIAQEKVWLGGLTV